MRMKLCFGTTVVIREKTISVYYVRIQGYKLPKPKENELLFSQIQLVILCFNN